MMFLLIQTVSSAAPRYGAPPLDLRHLSWWSKALGGMDWQWLVGYVAIAGGIFAVLLFGGMFIRRWQNPRLGFFLLTGTVILVRAWRPENVFWRILAPAAALLAIVLFVMLFRSRQYLMLKEPTYYLANAFALIVMSFPVGGYNIALALAALAVSLFFIVTKRSTSPEKFKGREADPIILESLEKRARRKR